MPSLLTRVLSMSMVVLALTTHSGCIGLKHKKMEIRQLETELVATKDASEFLGRKPALGQDFDAHIAVGATVFNQFLAGLDQYEVPIDNSRGVRLAFEQLRLLFHDGYPTASIDARAVDSSGEIVIKVRIRADILITAEPERERLVFRFLLREVVPELRWKELTWGKFWLAMAVLRIEGQKYIDSLPLTTVPLKAEMDIDVAPHERGRIELGGNAYVNVEQKLPRFRLGFVYRATQVVVLEDGIHVFFNLERKE